MPRKPAQPPVPDGSADDAAQPVELVEPAATVEPAAPVEPAASSPAMPPTVPPTPTTEAIPTPLPPSFLERLRRNRMGALTASLTVGLVAGLLLAVLVPSKPNLYAMVLLGLLITAAVGFTVRYLATCHGLRTQATAFLGAVVGIHVMAVTGTVNGTADGGVVAMLGLEGPGFDDALLAALATPAVSTGGLLAGLVAAIIAGWGTRGGSHHRSGAEGPRA